MLATIVGLLFAISGIWGVILWWPDFVGFMKGAVPFMLFCGGIIAVIVGISSINESSDNTEDETK